jgi:hypothetical protein
MSSSPTSIDVEVGVAVQLFAACEVVSSVPLFCVAIDASEPSLGR